jgi:hypothetical protein
VNAFSWIVLATLNIAVDGAAEAATASRRRFFRSLLNKKKD